MCSVAIISNQKYTTRERKSERAGERVKERLNEKNEMAKRLRLMKIHIIRFDYESPIFYDERMGKAEKQQKVFLKSVH